MPFKLLDLHLKDLGFLKGYFVFPILNILPVEGKCNFVITEVLLNSKVFVGHFVFSKSSFFHGQKLIRDLVVIQARSFGLLPFFSNIQQGLLLFLKLSEIMVPPQSSDLENIFKVRELIEYLVQILILDTEELRVSSSLWDIVVHIEGLKDETDLSEVATFVKVD